MTQTPMIQRIPELLLITPMCNLVIDVSCEDREFVSLERIRAVWIRLEKPESIRAPV